jgi:hypothetical protein
MCSFLPSPLRPNNDNNDANTYGAFQCKSREHTDDVPETCAKNTVSLLG